VSNTITISPPHLLASAVSPRLISRPSTHATKFMNVTVARFRKCSNLVPEGKGSSKIKPRLRAKWVVVRKELCILDSCCLSLMRRNSVLEALKVRMLTSLDQDESRNFFSCSRIKFLKVEYRRMTLDHTQCAWTTQSVWLPRPMSRVACTGTVFCDTMFVFWRHLFTCDCLMRSHQWPSFTTLISLAHHCYDWHPGSCCRWTCNQLTSKVDGGITRSRLRWSILT